MAVKVNISRILFIMVWCIVGGGVLVLLVAAMNYRNTRVCKGYKIEIRGPRLNGWSEMEEKEGVVSGAGEGLFVDKKAIEDILAVSGAGKGKGRPILSFDLHRMESALERNPWIRDAQLFFDNNEILRVNVVEREPVARIFSADGSSFYIDSSGVQLPLSDKLAAKLPVFTGYPATKVRLHGADSMLTDQVRKMGGYIRSDSFWMAQIAQVDITAARTFELVPTIGNHLIEFGDGDDYAAKFHRLFVFYKEVLSRTGFDKYSRIDVAYRGQVIGTRKGSEGSRSDSLQGMRNIQQLIRSAQQLQPDTMREANMKPLEHSTESEQTLTNYDLIPDKGDSAGQAAATKTGGAAGKQSPKPVMPGSPKAVTSGSPKAVMPAKKLKNN